MTRVHTSNLTSYDFVKFAAIVLMIVDHIGHFYYPDEMWLRAIGRLSAPIWLFLIGYARTRDLSWHIWAGAGTLIAVDIICGQSPLPLSILGSMILYRLVLDPVMKGIKRNPQGLYPMVAVFFIATILTSQLFEYGTEGFVLVMAGYICRNADAMNFDKGKTAIFLMVAAFVHYLSVIIFFFPNFTLEQKLFTGVGLVALMLALGKFRAAEYPALTSALPRLITWLVQFGGRWSLEIYVAHLAVFHFIALYHGHAEYEIFASIR
jgi:peptidoglycan/LPS O-acetylase OafA/YrhL